MLDPATADRIDGTLDDYRWLTSPAAREWLELGAAREVALSARADRLRSSLSVQQTHLVLQQAELRSKARAKFAAADRMFFTPRGLEQASDEIVAAYKARRFAGHARVGDLCCGIGGDLLALAARGETVGIDRDPVVALLAQGNARAIYGAPTAVDQATGHLEVRLGDVAELDVSRFTAWHIDPDRRAAGRRTTLVELHEPGAETVDRLLAQNRHAAVKLAPAARLPPSWIERAELEWISRGRQCRQLVAWFGDLAQQPARRRATVLSAAGEWRSIVGPPGQQPPVAARIGRYLLEPDAAVLAAKLEGVLAREHDLAAIAPGVAYWTHERPIADPLLACFAVEEVLPFRLQPLKALLRKRKIGRLEIKKRGVEHDPAALRKQLGLRGADSATLLVARIDQRVTAILARRVHGPRKE